MKLQQKCILIYFDCNQTTKKKIAGYSWSGLQKPQTDLKRCRAHTSDAVPADASSFAATVKISHHKKVYFWLFCASSVV